MFKFFDRVKHFLIPIIIVEKIKNILKIIWCIDYVNLVAIHFFENRFCVKIPVFFILLLV